MPKGVIPVLDINTPTLENRSDKLIYLLKFLLFNPGWTSSWYDDRLLSMRKSMAEYTEDPNKLVPALQRYLDTAIQKFYQDYHCIINVIKDEDDPTVYTMDISVVDSIGNRVITLDKIRKDDTGAFKVEGVDER